MIVMKQLYTMVHSVRQWLGSGQVKESHSRGVRMVMLYAGNGAARALAERARATRAVAIG
jgi:hypothetical protein